MPHIHIPSFRYLRRFSEAEKDRTPLIIYSTCLDAAFRFPASKMQRQAKSGLKNEPIKLPSRAFKLCSVSLISSRI
jgi:hypothetical protein